MSQLNLKTSIAGVEFDTILMNAAGVHCQSREELSDVANSTAATFVTKTATVSERAGNPNPRYFDFGRNSINSMGLPNYGLQYYLDYLATEEDEVAKKRFLSISPLQAGDVSTLLQTIKERDFRGFVELNLSCPNVPGKPQTAYDFEQTERILTEVFSQYNRPLGVKLPPYFDLVHFDTMAEILNQFPLAFINSINSIGNGIVINDDATVIAPKQGFGGIGGPIIKPTALANVHAFYQRLKPQIAIIGTGGVTSGRDVYEHLICGASMIQVGTALHQEGVSVFDRLISELEDILIEKEIRNLSEVIGSLRHISAIN